MTRPRLQLVGPDTPRPRRWTRADLLARLATIDHAWGVVNALIDGLWDQNVALRRELSRLRAHRAAGDLRRRR